MPKGDGKKRDQDRRFLEKEVEEFEKEMEEYRRAEAQLFIDIENTRTLMRQMEELQDLQEQMARIQARLRTSTTSPIDRGWSFLGWNQTVGQA